MKKTDYLQMKKVLPANTERVWELAIRLKTLQYIARPLLSFKPLDPLPGAVYGASVSCRFSLRFLGFFPLGMHRILILSCDKQEGMIRSFEHGSLARQWNHTIRLAPAKDGQTQYVDILEIEGAWGMTWLITAFAWLFYKHRQRRWVKLLRKDEEK